MQRSIAIGTQPADTAVAVGAQLDLTVVATATPPGALVLSVAEEVW